MSRPSVLGRFDTHERAVLLPLCLVGFSTNDDTGLLGLAAPALADGLGVSVAAFGVAVAVIRLGALGSVVTLRLADRWGRRPLLLVSVLASTLLTGLTAVSWGIVAFVVLQLLARLFPTEVRATVASLAGAVVVASGSAGLLVAGGLAGLVDPYTTVVVLALVAGAGALLLRGMPENAGADLIAPLTAPPVEEPA